MATLTEGHAPNDATRYESEDEPEFTVKELEQMLALLSKEQDIVDNADNYYFGKHPQPYVPAEASSEYKALAQRAVTNVVPLVIRNIAQLLYIENYLRKGESKAPKAWEAWRYNRLNYRQSAIYRTALRYGVSYVVALPPEDGKPYPSSRALSPRKMVALYADPANDEWPVFALEVVDAETKRYIVYTQTSANPIKVSEDGKTFTADGDEIVHGFQMGGLPTCPVIRVTYDLDLDGRYQGEIEQIQTEQDRLNQTVMDRLLVQTFGSWKIRTISGMVLPDDATDAASKKLQISKDRFLVADDPDTKFGSLPETPLTGFIQASQVDNESIAALAAVPPHYLTGTLNNLGAEAIAEARASLEAKAGEIKRAFGQHMEQLLRAFAFYMGDTNGAEDFSAIVQWADLQNRSLTQVADALGKIATMLSVPAQALWEKLPGVTLDEVERWKEMSGTEDVLTAVSEAINTPAPEEPVNEPLPTAD